MTAGALAGRRVMVVEDEFVIAMLLEDTLADHGCTIVGPFNTVPAAAGAARDLAIDIAVLDVNVQGEKIYPVAEVLAARGIPFLLLSGYGNDAIPPDRPHWQACSKPFESDQLVRRLSEQLEQQPQTVRPAA